MIYLNYHGRNINGVCVFCNEKRRYFGCVEYRVTFLRPGFEMTNSGHEQLCGDLLCLLDRQYLKFNSNHNNLFSKYSLLTNIRRSLAVDFVNI